MLQSCIINSRSDTHTFKQSQLPDRGCERDPPLHSQTTPGKGSQVQNYYYFGEYCQAHALGFTHSLNSIIQNNVPWKAGHSHIAFCKNTTNKQIQRQRKGEPHESRNFKELHICCVHNYRTR